MNVDLTPRPSAGGLSTTRPTARNSSPANDATKPDANSSPEHVEPSSASHRHETPFRITGGFLTGMLAIVVVAVLLRTIGTNTPLDSNDHVRLAYDCTFNWGWYWCFQINYGPLHPALTKLTAVVVTALNLPMTETLWRLPLILAGSALPVVTFFIVRRLVATKDLHANAQALQDSSATARSTPSPLQGEGWGEGCTHQRPEVCAREQRQPMEIARRSENVRTTVIHIAPWAAAVWVAVFPPFVADARYPWGYESLGVFCAVLSLLMLSRYLDKPTGLRAWVAGTSFALYLWSHLFVYALPIVWLHWIGATANWNKRAIFQLVQRTGLWLPPVGALAITVGMHLRFGGGPLGRFTYKAEITDTAFRGWNAPLELLQAWLGHFGWTMAAFVAIGFIVAAKSAFTVRLRATALWWWPLLFAMPYFALMCFQPPPGRISPYLSQASLALVLLTAVVLLPRLILLGGKKLTFACIGLTTLSLLIGTIDSNLGENRLAAATGVNATWGAARPNRGYRTMGWYVQKFVPEDAVVFTFHDFGGLELLPATYYCGRRCLAFCDMTPQQSLALFDSYKDDVTVIVIEKRLGVARSFGPDFEQVATISEGDHRLIDIYARKSASLPQMGLPVEEYDARYLREFATRVPGTPPTVAKALPSYQDVMARAEAIYQQSDREKIAVHPEARD